MTGQRRVLLALAMMLATTGALAAGAAPAGAPSDGLDSLLGPALRMVASLAGVLALVAGLAWLAQRLRTSGRFKSGLIEVVSGVSLGAREKVVLLRVGREQVLVGVSPAGMRALHVIQQPVASSPPMHRSDPPIDPPFSTYMERQP
jgi:flagellar protein FliO/FliZ